MNYSKINELILKNNGINDMEYKDNKFYSYLFNNKVAYYYCKNISQNSTKIEKKIISVGDKFNTKYLKTVKYLYDVCKQHDIDFMLFKTHKFIPEVVDGDIDLIVKKEDFNKFLEIFKRNGFSTIEDEPLKGKCIKNGFCVIEPHVNISWRENKFLEGELLWRDPLYLHYFFDREFVIKNISLEFEAITIIGQVLYEPKYFDLYSIKFLREQPFDIKKIKNIISDKIFIDCINYFRKNIKFNQKAPYFVSFQDYISESLKMMKNNKNIRMFIIHWVFYIYWKYRYLLINKLPYSHDWKVS